jgi:hypothetical protein
LMHSSRGFQCNTFFTLLAGMNRAGERGHPHVEAQPAHLSRCSPRGAARNADSSLMSLRSGNRVGVRSYPTGYAAIVPSENVAPLLMQLCQEIEASLGGPFHAGRRGAGLISRGNRPRTLVEFIPHGRIERERRSSKPASSPNGSKNTCPTNCCPVCSKSC